MNRFFLLLAASSFLCAGCARGPGRRGAHAAYDAAVAFSVAYEIAEQARNSVPGGHEDILDLPDPVYVQYVPVAPEPPQRYAPPASPPPAGPRAFDLGAAQSSLASVAFDACKSEGLAPGYAHATVAFAPDGTVQAVALDLPAGTSSDARACIESAFRASHVAPFSGDNVMNVRRSFYVSA
ncbi:MAG TPA: hypothetical protein VF765_26705 [Polyangiaceae bacterium]